MSEKSESMEESLLKTVSQIRIAIRKIDSQINTVLVQKNQDNLLKVQGIRKRLDEKLEKTNTSYKQVRLENIIREADKLLL